MLQHNVTRRNNHALEETMIPLKRFLEYGRPRGAIFILLIKTIRLWRKNEHFYHKNKEQDDFKEGTRSAS